MGKIKDHQRSMGGRTWKWSRMAAVGLLMTTVGCLALKNPYQDSCADVDVTRLRSGDFDPTFVWCSGFMTLDTPDVQHIKDLAVDENGRIMLSFRLTSTDPLDTGSYISDWGFARVSSKGVQDWGFNGGTGHLRWDFTGADQYEGNEMLIRDGSGWLAPGYVREGSGDFDIAVARVKDDGALDASYGNQSGVFYHVPGTDLRETLGRGGFRQSDGKLFVSGQGGSTSAQIAFYRITSTGAMDATFGTGGMVTLPNFTGVAPSGEYVQNLYLNSAGDRVTFVFYSYTAATVTPSGVGRILLDGTVDTAFGTSSGKTLLDPPAGMIYCSLTSGDSLSDGDIAMIGYCADSASTQYKPFFHRINGDGTLDPAYGSQISLNIESVWPVLSSYPKILVQAALVDSSDRLIIGITAYTSTASGNPYSLYIGRLNKDGTADSSFGDGGIIKQGEGTTASNFGGYARLTQDSDGKILAAAAVMGSSGEKRIRVWRIVP